MTPEDNYYMQCALHEAESALLRGDVPVGAILVKDNAVISSGKIIAIRSGSQKLGHWNLSGCTLYVTLEPCPMCAGACVNARVSRVVYGAKNYRSGAAGTLYDILRDTRLNHVCKVEAGVMQNECLEILQGYFLRRREKCSS